MPSNHPLPLGEGRVRVSGFVAISTLTRRASRADLSQRERFGSISLLIAFPLLLLACSRPAAGLKQIQQQHSGDYIVTVFNESGVLKLRSDHLTVEFRNASTNELANVSNVQIQASMVMPGMGPMFGNLGPPRQDVPGRYDFDADVEMAGQWNLVITFDPKGRAQFALRAQ